LKEARKMLFLQDGSKWRCTRVQSGDGKLQAGVASPRLYGLYDGNTTPGSYPEGGFHGITLGDNTPYPALPGWDFASGFGSLWGGELATDLKK
jgi:hypothetical protein